MRGSSTPGAGLLNSAEFARDPYPFYSEWREQDTAHYLTDFDAWLILDYDSVSSALKQPRLFSSSPGRHVSPTMHGADPPDHTAVRQLLAPLLTRESQMRIAHTVRQIAEDVIARVVGAPTFDVVADFASPFAVAVSAEWLGLTRSATAALEKANILEVAWTDIESALTGKGVASEIAASGGFSEAQRAELVAFFVTASLSTSRDFIPFALSALIQRRQLADAMRLEPSLLPALVDELLRLEPPAHTLVRSATADVRIAGKFLPSGSLVWLSLAAANRDPLRFADPEQVDLTRESPRSLTFAAGPHFCCGSHLGRLQAEIMLESLLPHLHTLRRAPGEQRIRFDGHAGVPALRRTETLMMTFLN